MFHIINNTLQQSSLNNSVFRKQNGFYHYLDILDNNVSFVDTDDVSVSTQDLCMASIFLLALKNLYIF